MVSADASNQIGFGSIPAAAYLFRTNIVFCNIRRIFIKTLELRKNLSLAAYLIYER